MTLPRLRVEIGVEPFVLSSAIHSCLDGDPWLDVVLGRPRPDWSGTEESGTAEPVAWAIPHARVTAVSEDPPRVQLLVNGDHRFIPYQGIERLADALVQALHGWNNKSATTPETHNA